MDQESVKKSPVINDGGSPNLQHATSQRGRVGSCGKRGKNLTRSGLVEPD